MKKNTILYIIIGIAVIIGIFVLLKINGVYDITSVSESNNMIKIDTQIPCKINNDCLQISIDAFCEQTCKLYDVKYRTSG